MSGRFHFRVALTAAHDRIHRRRHLPVFEPPSSWRVLNELVACSRDPNGAPPNPLRWVFSHPHAEPIPSARGSLTAAAASDRTTRPRGSSVCRCPMAPLGARWRRELSEVPPKTWAPHRHARPAASHLAVRRDKRPSATASGGALECVRLGLKVRRADGRGGGVPRARRKHDRRVRRAAGPHLCASQSAATGYAPAEYGAHTQAPRARTPSPHA
jgi:hypothetical protein